MADTPSPAITAGTADAKNTKKPTKGTLGGIFGTLGIPLLLAGGAGGLVWDATQRDGEFIKTVIPGAYGEEVARTGGAVGGFLKSSWDSTLSPIVKGAWGAITHPAGNPWFQGFAAIAAMIMGWKFASMWTASQTGVMSKLLTGTAGFIGVAALGLAVASAAGMIRNDGPSHDPNKPLPSAATDLRLAAPQ